MDFEVVIGLEVHAQLSTESKMFCPCSSDYQDTEPNTVVCPVCMGMPGVLPVINRRAVEHVIRTGLALDCDIASYTKFDRKNYPYPDLMKGYQISQYDLPIASNGAMPIEVDGAQRSVGITRVHLEEDVAKLIHRTEEFGEGYSLLDVNRAGVPLMEIVGEPDLRSAEEARAYLIQLHSILQYVGSSSANMEEGNFRCDANISVRPTGQAELGTKVEIKNMNSFRSVFQALNFEAGRQRRVVEDGGRVVQETRGWVEERAVTVSQRSKEEAHDYRYFPEPDLPPLDVATEWVEEIRARLPELAPERCARFEEEYGLPQYDARLLTSGKAMADYFEQAVTARPEPVEGPGPVEGRQAHAKQVSNWMLGDLSGLLNQENRDIADSPVSPEHLVELIGLVEEGVISGTMGKTVLEEAYASSVSPQRIVQAVSYTHLTLPTKRIV